MARVVSWNVAGRVRSVGAQAAALAGCGADVVALQEVRATARPAWERETRLSDHAAIWADLRPPRVTPS